MSRWGPVIQFVMVSVTAKHCCSSKTTLSHSTFLSYSALFQPGSTFLYCRFQIYATHGLPDSILCSVGKCATCHSDDSFCAQSRQRSVHVKYRKGKTAGSERSRRNA